MTKDNGQRENLTNFSLVINPCLHEKHPALRLSDKGQLFYLQITVLLLAVAINPTFGRYQP